MTASIVGWAHTPFGKFDTETVESLVVRVANEALADAGIAAADVDVPQPAFEEPRDARPDRMCVEQQDVTVARLERSQLEGELIVIGLPIEATPLGDLDVIGCAARQIDGLVVEPIESLRYE